MIKIETHKNLLFEKSKMIRQPVPLKKNLIAFPGQNTQSPRASTASFISRAVKSPSKQASERLKINSQRQKQIQNYEEIIEKFSMPPNQEQSHNPEKLMQRSYSHRISASKNYRNTTSTANPNAKRPKTIKSARTSEDQIGIKTSQESKQFYSRKMSQIQISNKINLRTNRKYDLNNFMINPNKNALIICKSLTKNSQLDFFDNQISRLINKKVDEKAVEENDLSDETSFNVILQRIRQKNKSESSETDFQTKKLRYMDKLKHSALTFDSPQRKSVGNNQLKKSENEQKIFRSSQFSKKGNFKAALQWSSKRLQLMKSPFIKSMKSKKMMLEKEKAKKEEEQIEGWIK